MRPLEDRAGSEAMVKHLEACHNVVRAAVFAAEQTTHGTRQEAEMASERFMRAVLLSIGTGEVVFRELGRGPLVDPPGGLN